MDQSNWYVFKCAIKEDFVCCPKSIEIIYKMNHEQKLYALIIHSLSRSPSHNEFESFSDRLLILATSPCLT